MLGLAKDASMEIHYRHWQKTEQHPSSDTAQNNNCNTTNSKTNNKHIKHSLRIRSLLSKIGLTGLMVLNKALTILLKFQYVMSLQEFQYVMSLQKFQYVTSLQKLL